MAQQTINTGAAANDGSGDKLRTAFTKAQANFTELYSNVSGLTAADITLGDDITALQTSSAIGGADGQIQYNNGGFYGGSSDLTFDDTTGLLSVKNVVTPAVTVVHSPPTAVELDGAGPAEIYIQLTGDIEFTTTNLANGRGVTVHLDGQGGADSALTFPVSWVFLGDAPTELLTGKAATFTIKSLGATDADVRIAFVAQL